MQHVLRPPKFFDPDGQPQDLSDPLGQLYSDFFAQANEISQDINAVNKRYITIHSIVEAERQIKKQYLEQVVSRQREILQELGEGFELSDEEIKANLNLGDDGGNIYSRKQSTELDEIRRNQKIQVHNIQCFQESIAQFGKYYKIRSSLALDLNEVLKVSPGEKVWPTANELATLSPELLQDLKVCTLMIIQKNSQRSRGDQWGHAFFLRLRLDQGLESPMMGQDEW